ncbi:uncharacterized protein LOC120266673 [Dioscorea cayenensis subsp. rotundata]|uniref:Uncharacterized protein LOC120266673 n=1 Tax=Dioscorea cayennensis subsp. rotundata TaxID=55577 RepID=A0AB40BS00_DIOCR|nr:uncharacterized protein LOC120266673 [Dioscorea cayenensis subsp. rotundata]
MRDPEMCKPCKVCMNYPTFREGPICEVCGFPTSGEFRRTHDVSNIPNSGKNMLCEHDAKIRSPPSNSLLAKRNIDSQDINAAPSKKPCNVYGDHPMFSQGPTFEECSYSTSADWTQDVSKIPSEPCVHSALRLYHFQTISSGITMLCEHDAKIRSPPSNSLLAKRKIDSQDMNGAPFKKSNVQDTQVKHLK